MLMGENNVEGGGNWGDGCSVKRGVVVVFPTFCWRNRNDGRGKPSPMFLATITDSGKEKAISNPKMENGATL